MQKIPDHELRKAIGEIETIYKANALDGYAKLKDLAMLDFDRALKVDAHSEKALSSKAQLFQDIDKDSEELETLNALVSVAPKNASYYSRRADVCARLRDYDKAIADFTVALRLNPSNKDDLMNRAVCYRLIGKSDLALRDCDSCVLGPKDIMAADTRGDLYFYFKQYPKAVKDWQRDAYPDGVTLAKVAYSYQVDGQTARALDYWKRSLKVSSADDAFRFKFLYLEAETLLEHGDKTHALAEAEAALQSYKVAEKTFPGCSGKSSIFPAVTTDAMVGLIAKAKS